MREDLDQLLQVGDHPRGDRHVRFLGRGVLALVNRQKVMALARSRVPAFVQRHRWFGNLASFALGAVIEGMRCAHWF